MQLLNTLKLKFEKPDWALNPEFGLIDSVLELHPELYSFMKEDICQGEKENNFGRKDVPTVEQIVRAAIYKEMKGLDYRELEYAQSDSRICSQFIKLNERKPYSFQMLQKYICKIKSISVQKVLVEINKKAIQEGFEDIEKLRTDSTVVESNIHYPTNNSLVWDCIKESHRLLGRLKEEMDTLNFRDYTRAAKKTHFKINNVKSKDQRAKLFINQLVTFTKTINEVSNAIKKKSVNIQALAIQISLEGFLPILRQVYDMTYRKEFLGEVVPNEKKIFSIYEQHTDIIVKGQREVNFGHKVNLASGKSNLILEIDVLRGNPSDSGLFQPMVERVVNNYGKVPRDIATDGGYASLSNQQYSNTKGIVNVVFNKITGSLKNIVSSSNMETRLKKWRSGIEAIISNFKRGYNIRVCTWKGWDHFQAKVMWSAVAYNFRVLTSLVLGRISGIPV